MARKKTPSTEPAPHSWSLDSWPPGVWPHEKKRARYLLRTHRNELVIAGALSRVGREVIVLGTRYTEWLQKRAGYVSTYEIAANRDGASA